MTRASLPALRLSVLLGACGSAVGCLVEESGLPYDRLSISVVREDRTSISGFPTCVTLPILNGSVVEERHAIEDGLALEVFATNSAVELSFSGASQGPAFDRTIGAERLRGAYAESFELASGSGTLFMVGLGSSCAAGENR